MLLCNFCWQSVRPGSGEESASVWKHVRNWTSRRTSFIQCQALLFFTWEALWKSQAPVCSSRHWATVKTEHRKIEQVARQEPICLGFAPMPVLATTISHLGSIIKQTPKRTYGGSLLFTEQHGKEHPVFQYPGEELHPFVSDAFSYQLNAATGSLVYTSQVWGGSSG